MTDSANLDLVRSIYADWERGDYTSTDWADPDIEFAFVDGPDPRSSKGISGMARGWGEFQSMWARGFHADPIEFRELTDEYVLVTVEFVGRAKGSDMDLAAQLLRRCAERRRPPCPHGLGGDRGACAAGERRGGLRLHPALISSCGKLEPGEGSP